MDCEKFDQHVMDALYDELDELTYAAMKRHMDSCARCASAFSGLRAARDVGALPLEEPSEDLEARILDAVEVAQKKTPFRRKALRALAWAGSHAMRPQLAMAALFVLVIGSSLLLLRPKTSMAPVRVTEWGQPASDQVEPSSAAAPTAFAAPASPASEEGDGRRAAEAKASEAPRPVDAVKEKGERVTGDPEGSAVAAFREAQALQRKSGCSAALGKLDEVGALYPGTSAAHAAMWEAVQCHQQAGDTEKARELLLALRSTKTYSDRAERALQILDGSLAAAQSQNAATATATAGRAAAAKRAAAPAPPASAPAASAAPGVAAAPPPPAKPAAADRPSDAFDAAR
ncbi:hypothetical protein SOCE26_072530 [Sorangium cellulosum]|uniref:Putative zinc-finger domain-containing protein n=1 Tax=Sorangium cellulosum TaxID=56 RepID=A0A2L0F2J0_SORCE|nr:zf-HC2 domain-containing protein [Sorangium cellulosum]AUX45757.1 hypothetical protein SOCE26_072530 [Sorangium cellulosum]